MHIWPSKQVMKSSKLWQTAGKGEDGKEWKYDILGLSDKEREEIAIAKQKRLERRAKKKTQE